MVSGVYHHGTPPNIRPDVLTFVGSCWINGALSGARCVHINTLHALGRLRSLAKFAGAVLSFDKLTPSPTSSARQRGCSGSISFRKCSNILFVKCGTRPADVLSRRTGVFTALVETLSSCCGVAVAAGMVIQRAFANLVAGDMFFAKIN
jgi:hypothetical protein